MREIKFRGISVRDGDWCYGSLEQTDNRTFIMEEVITESIGQFTGLKDVNEVEIYEGDILDCSNTSMWDVSGPAGHDSPIIVVKWQDDLTGYDPFANYDCDCGVYILPLPNECEVIGNIYENEELLSKGGEENE